MDKIERVTKKIRSRREELGLRLEDVANSLKRQGVEITISGLHRIESGGRQKLDANLLVGLSNILDYNFFDMLGWKAPKENSNYSIKEKEKILVKIYTYDSSKAGRIDLENFTEEALMVEDEISNSVNEGIIIKIKGNFMQPHFYEGDVLLIEKEKFENWQELDRKIVLYEFDGETYIRKVLFENAKGYLIAFNNRLYENIEINEKITYIGRVRKQINIRDLDNIEF